MDTYRGIHIYLKDNRTHSILRDLIQVHKTQYNNSQFSFVATDSLLPNLSLWENLHMVTGGHDWPEVLDMATPQEQALMRLIKNPKIMTHEAQDWEKFIISLLKGMNNKGSLLIDIKEDEFSPLIIQLLKKTLMATKKNILIASHCSSVWLDCSTRIYSKKDYKIQIEELDTDLVFKHWAA